MTSRRGHSQDGSDALVIVIDFSPYRAPFNGFLAGSVREFAEEHPDVEVSCVAFSGCPQLWEGVINFYGSICLDTENHSAGTVAKYQHFRHGEDEFGRYCDSPFDFAFSEYRNFSIEGLEAPGETGIFQSVTGQRYKLDYDEGGDPGLCWVVWHGLFGVLMKEFQDFGRLKRAPVFRMGGKIFDGCIGEFWRC